MKKHIEVQRALDWGVRGPRIQPLQSDLEKVISPPPVSDVEKVELNNRLNPVLAFYSSKIRQPIWTKNRSRKKRAWLLSWPSPLFKPFPSFHQPTVTEHLFRATHVKKR